MCGRYTFTAPLDQLVAHYGLAAVPETAPPPRYNIAPGQTVLGVRLEEARPARCLVPLRWGLVPHWSQDPKIGHRLINARAESLTQRPAFREAFRRRRCLIPATGFYEWRTEDGRRQPYYLHRADGGLLSFAGLWERWTGTTPPLETCTVITTAARGVVAPLHARMPALLDPADYAAWLDPRTPAPAAAALLRPTAPPLVAYPVSPRVNHPGHGDPACLAPLP